MHFTESTCDKGMLFRKTCGPDKSLEGQWHRGIPFIGSTRQFYDLRQPLLGAVRNYCLFDRKVPTKLMCYTTESILKRPILTKVSYYNTFPFFSC